MGHEIVTLATGCLQLQRDGKLVIPPAAIENVRNFKAVMENNVN